MDGKSVTTQTKSQQMLAGSQTVCFYLSRDSQQENI